MRPTSSLSRAEIQRVRILDAMVDIVGERGFAAASVALIAARAKVSSRTFYELFEGRRDCFLALIDEQTERAEALVKHAFESESAWLDGLRAALTTLLVFLDSEPMVARVWLVEVLAAGSWALERRVHNVSRLTGMIVAAWDLPDGWEPPQLAAEGVMTSILGVLHNHLVAGSSDPLISLLGPLTGIMTRPYLDHGTVAREIARGEGLAEEIRNGRPWQVPALAAAPVQIPPLLANPGARRARECLRALAARPGSSNRDLASSIGVVHQSQASMLLSSLAREGLAVKRSYGVGLRNSWQITTAGERILQALQEHQR